ncbi:MAG: AbrB/MazE/SpoVT family DNA-binding domain-containing protein [bacterium]|nr:AbrB/MazE/SpoVT family DNA-binding domain-containing protein [bacterium]
MVFTATITSQGQITIPAKARKKLGLIPSKKIIITMQEDSLLLQLEPDLMELSGSLHKYAIKNKSIEEIMKMEKKAIEQAKMERFKRKNF